jgi:hypothetical protein
VRNWFPAFFSKRNVYRYLPAQLRTKEDAEKELRSLAISETNTDAAVVAAKHRLTMVWLYSSCIQLTRIHYISW